jgi:[ribosomal protein S18]-alanine N-acetyltransferase
MVHGTTVRVRPAKPADLPRLVEIASHSATAAQWCQAEYLKLFAPDQPQSQIDVQPQANSPIVEPRIVDQQIIDPQLVNCQNQSHTQPRTALVVEQDGSVSGFIVGRLVDDEWEIENIAVTGAARRRGLGSRLVGELLDLVRSRGGKSVFLEVRESNRAARSLYEKWAFVEVGRRKMYYQNPPEDALLLKFKFP